MIYHRGAEKNEDFILNKNGLISPAKLDVVCELFCEANSVVYSMYAFTINLFKLQRYNYRRIINAIFLHTKSSGAFVHVSKKSAELVVRYALLLLSH